MEVRYTKIFADDQGRSRFEDVALELSPGFAAPPAQPLHQAPFLAAEGTFWLGGTADWVGEVRHPAPARVVFVLVQGECEVTVSDGTVRRFAPGNVLLLEDTTGDGHSTRIIGPNTVIVLAVRLPST